MIPALVLLLTAPATTFQKHVLDTRFISEGVAVADMNRDRKLDILAGNVWYEAPDWQPHEIAPVPTLDPKTQYSNCFNNWAADLNSDGWPDQILIGMPGEKAVWRENPAGRTGPWKEHPIWRSAGNESPLYVDLFENGKKVLVMGTDDRFLAWFEPAVDPHQEWIMHPISGEKGAGSQRYSHGLGVGNLLGTRGNEVLTTGGYYAMKEGQPNEPWSFVPSDLGPDCAQMLVLGPKRGFVTTSAHARGVWWFRPKAGGGFQREVIDQTISGTHSAYLARFGYSQPLNLVTGKRRWAHPPGVDVGSEEASWLVRYELNGDKWTRHVIDESSGVGTQFAVEDINGDGLADIVTSNKNGVFLFTAKGP
jgi:hypothetical protein